MRDKTDKTVEVNISQYQKFKPDYVLSRTKIPYALFILCA